MSERSLKSNTVTRRTWVERASCALALLLTSISIVRLAYYSGYADGLGELAATTDYPIRLFRLQFWISLGLVVSTVGFLPRKKFGPFLSLVSLLFVLSVYGWWRLQTSRFLNDPDIKRAREVYGQFREIGWLNGATAWDYVVLSGVLLTLVWLTFRLAKIFLSRRKKTKRSA